MAKQKDKVQNALDEARILLLGTQVLIGFSYRAFFEEAFESLAGWAKAAALAALSLMLLAFCLTSLPASYHRLVARGEDREDVHAFANWALRVGLLPMALGMGLDFAIASARGIRAAPAAALALGAAATAVALGAWYVYTYGARTRHGHRAEEAAMEETQVHEKIRHVLTEARMVLPGAQALLGFQFAVTLTRTFDDLPQPLRLLHLAVLGLISLAVVLLITPAAYHRIVERGDETEHFHRVSSRFVLVAMLPLALGLCGDFVVVVYKVAHSYAAAIGAAGVALALFFGLWFGFPLALARRRGRQPDGGRRGALRPAQA